MSNTPPTYIGSADVCERLKIDRSTLSRWVAAGRLTPAMRLSSGPTGAFLFSAEDVEALAVERAS